MRLAKPIHDSEGRLVAGAGTMLNDRIVGLLRKLAIQTVQVAGADDLPEWETIKPLTDALAELDTRFATAGDAPELEQLRAAVARSLTRRARLLGEDPEP